ncbi:MAG: putative sugar nucleotidyl transferase [bacterium]
MNYYRVARLIPIEDAGSGACPAPPLQLFPPSPKTWQFTKITERLSPVKQPFPFNDTLFLKTGKTLSYLTVITIVLCLIVVCIYEDENWGNFYPLVDLRAVFELLFGCRTFLGKLRRRYPRERFNLWVREEVAGVIAERYPDCSVNQPIEPPALFISASAVLDERLQVSGAEEMFVAKKRLIGFRLNKPRSWKPGFLGRLQLGMPEKEVKARLYVYPWELITENSQELVREIKPLNRGKKLVIRGHNARIHRGSCIATEKGPVLLDEGSEVRPLSFVEGPCYIGPGTIIDGALVRPGCSFGPQCRIGGEVESSIFQGYVNKHHQGFLGHSFIGEWVNLGALTTGSDLKNNYQPVKMILGNRRIDTGLLKLGCFIGDHAKTAIGTMIPTGAIIGTFANWFEPGPLPRQVSAFAWGKNERWLEEEVIKTLRLVLARRNITPGLAYEKLLLKLYHRTSHDDSFGRR